jgi:hypothetical protein
MTMVDLVFNPPPGWPQPPRVLAATDRLDAGPLVAGTPGRMATLAAIRRFALPGRHGAGA